MTLAFLVSGMYNDGNSDTEARHKGMPCHQTYYDPHSVNLLGVRPWQTH